MTDITEGWTARLGGPKVTLARWFSLRARGGPGGRLADRPPRNSHERLLAGRCRNGGTTITPWGQGFIQAYATDKRLGPLVSGRFLLAVGWIITIALALMSLTLVWTTIFPVG